MANKRPLQWWSSPRAILRHILMVDDTPHAIALGTAIGLFIGMTPTVGIQMFLVMLIAFVTSRLFYFNRPAALFAVYISNPITTLPIYWMDYKVGTLFLDGELERDTLGNVLQFHGLRQWWDALCTLFVDIGAPLLLGSLIVGALSAALAYPAIWWLVRKIQGPPAPRKPRIDANAELSATMH